MSLPPPISLSEAQHQLLGEVEPLSDESIAVEEAQSRYLAQELRANRTQPAADLSAMDGYAVREDDLAGPWRVIGESAAGHPFDREVTQGEAVRISTGAVMPDASGAVLLQENALREGDALSLLPGAQPMSRHIRRAGFDFQAGDLLLKRGSMIGPAQIALAISGGHAAVAAHRLPVVAVLDSGDELVADPASCAAHQIPASNGPMLGAMVAPYARKIIRLGPVADKMDAILNALNQTEEADVIVTSGGASVGDHDLVRPALEQWGASIDFWRVAMKPGKPVMVARRGKQIVLGLPGNPVSSYVTAFLLLLPLLRRLAGANLGEVLSPSARAVLQKPLPATDSRQEFIRAHHASGEVIPLHEQDSSALAALSASNALIDRPAGSSLAEVGDMVRILLL